MKTLKTLLLIVITTFVYYNGHSSEVKIATVDINKIMDKSPAYNEAKEIFNKKIQNLQKETLSSTENLYKQYEDLDKKRNVLSLKEYNHRKNELKGKEEKLQKKLYDLKFDIDMQVQEIQKVMDEKLKEVIKNIAKEKKLKVVLSDEIIFYRDASIDITDITIKRFNKEIESSFKIVHKINNKNYVNKQIN